MSVDHTFYVGVFFKVVMPEIKVTKNGLICTKCEKIIKTKFCPNCGNQTLEMPFTTIERQNFGEFCEKTFGEWDLFCSQGIDDELIVMGNHADQPGFVRPQEVGITEIPTDTRSGDWERLANALNMANIKYDVCFGIVGYYS